MKYSYSATGANQPLVKEFEVKSDAFIEKGQAAVATDGVITENTNGGTFIGICDETHTGKPDILNARSDKNKVRVIVSPDAVFASKCIAKECTSDGTSTTVSVSADGIDENLVRGATAFCKGEMRKILSCTISGNVATITLAEGEISEQGDIVEIYPALNTKMYLDENKNGVVFANTSTDVTFKTVGFDADKKEIFVMCENLLFA